MRLGFGELDELSFLASSGDQITGARILPGDLGPLVEFEWLKRSGVTLPNIAADSQRARLLRSILGGEKYARFENSIARSRFISCHWEADEETDDWFFFCKSLQET